MALGSGVRQDAGRLSRSSWAQDWATRGKLRILAASTYICLASAIPALAFGVQIASETNDVLSPVSVLAATACTGVLQALVGGQPLLIVGVAEPIVLTYSYMYSFAKDQDGLGRERFLPWAAWTCVWAAVFIIILALTNACSYISRFTRLSGELFGMLIALLFMQQAIKGSVEEFRGGGGSEGGADASASATPPADGATWQLVNGLWSLLLAFGLLLSCMLVRTARSWRFLRAPLRGLLADYGAALMLVTFSGLSFAVHGSTGTSSVPRRVQSPNTWDVKSSWTVAADMGGLEGRWIAAALIPAALITVLFFFDHNVSAQLAQQEEFNLQKPTAYHWDFLLLGLMTLLCGLLGLPPVNGVLPQSPMHTKALAKVAGKRSTAGRHRAQTVQQGEPGTPRGSQAAADGSARPAAGSLELASQAAWGIHASPSAQKLLPRTLASSSSSSADLGPASGGPPGPAPVAAGAVLQGGGAAAGAAGPAAGQAAHGSIGHSEEAEVVAVKVYEQRWSGLLQSLGVGVCLAAMPAIRQIPTASLWGYFAFMAIESLPGSQFWDRILLLLTDPARRAALLERGHAPYLETVPFRTIAFFTAFQLTYLLLVYALTWAGVAGILFPLPIMALVPLRTWVLPRCFAQRRHLQELDAAHEEEAAPLSHEQALQEAAAQGLATAARGAGAPAGGGGSEDEGEGGLPDSELHRLRVVHHLSRESLIRRRSTMEAEADAAAGPASALPDTLPPLPGSAAFSPRAAAGLRRRSHELPHV